MSLHERIKRMRIMHKLTQQEVANKLGIARGTYSNYETGLREPDAKTIASIADLFGVTTDYLLGIEKYERTIDNTGNQIQESINKGDIESSNIDPEWLELYGKVKEKGAELEATALLRSASTMSKKKLQAVLQVLDFIEKDDD